MPDRRPRRRRPLAAVPTEDTRSPIDAAIDASRRVAWPRSRRTSPIREVGRIPLLLELHRWDQDSEVTVTAVPGDVPTFLMWDGAQGAWRAVVLPDNTTWRIVPDRAGLWTPGAR